MQKMLVIEMEKTREFAKDIEGWKYSHLETEFKNQKQMGKELQELKETIKKLNENLSVAKKQLISSFEEFEALQYLEEKKREELQIENLYLRHERDEMTEKLINRQRELENLRKLHQDLLTQKQNHEKLPVQLGKRKFDQFSDLNDNQLSERQLKRRKIARCEELLRKKMTQVEDDAELESLFRSEHIRKVCGEEECDRVVVAIQEYRRKVNELNTQIIEELKPSLEKIATYSNKKICDCCENYSEYLVEFPCRHHETKICVDSCFPILVQENGNVWCNTCGRGFM